MTTLWAVMKMELRLLWRQPTFWMVELIILIAPLISSFLALNSLGLVYFIWPTLVLILSLIPILLLQAIFLPLIVGPAMRRDLGRVGDLLWVTPLDAATHLAGVAGGLWLSLLPLFVVQTALLCGLNHWFAMAESNSFWLYWLLALVACTTGWLGGAILAAVFVPRTLLLQIVWIPLVFFIWSKIPFDSVFPSDPEAAFLVAVVYPMETWLMLAHVGAGVGAVLLALGAALLVDQRRALLPLFALKGKDSHGHSH